LFLHKDSSGVSDVNDTSIREVDASGLREVLSFGVLAVKLRQELHIIRIVVLFLRDLPRVTHEGMRGEQLLDLIAHWLCLKASFKPDPHFFCN
jgi:hypothetical protein